MSFVMDKDSICIRPSLYPHTFTDNTLTIITTVLMMIRIQFLKCIHKCCLNKTVYLNMYYFVKNYLSQGINK